MSPELEMLSKFEEENRWFQANFERLQHKFANKYVAVENNDVIASGRSATDVVKKAETKTKNMATLLIEFVPKKGLVVII